jgi:hypothetical protein
MTAHRCLFLRGSEKLSINVNDSSDGVYIEELIVEFNSETAKLELLKYVLDTGKIVDALGVGDNNRREADRMLHYTMGPELIQMLHEDVQPRIKIHCNCKHNMPIEKFLPHIGYILGRDRVFIDVLTGQPIRSQALSKPV